MFVHIWHVKQMALSVLLDRSDAVSGGTMSLRFYNAADLVFGTMCWIVTWTCIVEQARADRV